MRYYKEEMIGKLPEYERNSKVISDIYLAFEREIRDLDAELLNLERNLFIDTADSLLSRWEKMLLIDPGTLKDYESRRERIKSALRSTGTTTIQMIENVVSSFSGAEIEVYEKYKEYEFEIKFLSPKGVPENIESVKSSLEEIKPAHLNYILSYTYSDWIFASELTWNDIKTQTWSGVRTWGGGL